MEQHLKFCPICGVKVEEKFNFCMSCGASLSTNSDAVLSKAESDGAEAIVVPDSEDMTVSEASSLDIQNDEIAQAEDVPADSEDSMPNDVPSSVSASPWDTPTPTPVSDYSASAVPALRAVTVQNSKDRSVGFKNKTVHNVIIFVASLLMLALAFCPIASMRVQISGYDSTSVGFSSLDSIRFCFDSLFSMSDTALQNSEVYADAMEALSRVNGGATSGILGVNFAANDAYKKLIRVMLRGDSVSLKLTVAVSAVFSLIYVMTCVVLLLRSFLTLILGLFGKRARLLPSMKLLCTLVGMIPPLYFVVGSMCRFGILGVFDGFVPGNIGISWGSVLSLVISVGAIAYVGICYARQLRGKWKLKEHMRDAFALLLVVVMLFAVFAPALTLTATVSPTDGGEADKVSLGAGYSDLSELTSIDKRHYANQRDADVAYMFENALLTLGNMDLFDRLFGVSDDELGATLSNYLILGCAEEWLGDLYPLIFFFTIALLLCIGGLLATLLKCVCSAELGAKRVIAAKAFLILFAILNAVVMTVIVWIAKANINQLNISESFSVSLGYGTASTLLLGILLALVPIRKKEGGQEAQDYAVADVSYSPNLKI